MSEITELFGTTTRETEHLLLVAKNVVTILEEGYPIGFLLAWIPWLHGAAAGVAEIPLHRLQQNQKAPTTRAARLATLVWESDFADDTSGQAPAPPGSLAEQRRRPTRTRAELFRGLSAEDNPVPACPACGLVPSANGWCNCS